MKERRIYLSDNDTWDVVDDGIRIIEGLTDEDIMVGTREWRIVWRKNNPTLVLVHKRPLKEAKKILKQIV